MFQICFGLVEDMEGDSYVSSPWNRSQFFLCQKTWFTRHARESIAQERESSGLSVPCRVSNPGNMTWEHNWTSQTVWSALTGERWEQATMCLCGSLFSFVLHKNSFFSMLVQNQVWKPHIPASLVGCFTASWRDPGYHTEVLQSSNLISLIIFCLICMSSSLEDTGCDGMMCLAHLSRVRTSLDSSRAEFLPAQNEEFTSTCFLIDSEIWVSLVSHRTLSLGIPWKISLQFFHRNLLSKWLPLIIIFIFCYNFTCYT